MLKFPTKWPFYPFVTAGLSETEETLGRASEDELIASFTRALKHIYMVFQPIVSWGERGIVAYEALVRSREPALARPDLLFSAAERLGTMIPVGRRIRKVVAKQIKKAPVQASIFVNVHARELTDPELYMPDAPLSRVASRIVLEITERWSLEKFHDVRERIQALRALGYRVAVDDLGAGYAGLSSFAHLRPEIVKLDMSLIRGVNEDPTRQHLIRSLNGVCRDLGIRVVAEGIETPDERDALVALGSDLLQGYLFGKPASEFSLVAAGLDGPPSIDGRPVRSQRAELLELRETLTSLIGRLVSAGSCQQCGPLEGDVGAFGRRALRSIEALLRATGGPSLRPIPASPSRSAAPPASRSV